MCLWLAEALGLDLARSWLVGDKASDLKAARAAGMAGAIHVLTGHGPDERAKALAVATDTFPILTADSLADVAALVETGRLPS
jgi:D-glycero-D-manno-heptose 1,7-bisphosphate phosphatase